MCLALPVLSTAGAAQFTAHASGLTVAHALATLSAAPVLAELCTWTDWDMLYGPVLGALAAFLTKHQAQLGFRALEVPGGSLLKLPVADGGLDLQQLRVGLKQALEQVCDRVAGRVGCGEGFCCCCSSAVAGS